MCRPQPSKTSTHNVIIFISFACGLPVGGLDGKVSEQANDKYPKRSQ
ncbi:MAG: hypothetical protein R2688_07300 [Fimbriimonadaceae bacterium]